MSRRYATDHNMPPAVSDHNMPPAVSEDEKGETEPVFFFPPPCLETGFERSN